MNHIFHYHVTGFLALKAGFSPAEAHELATSAQMVDQALMPYTVRIPGVMAPYLTPVTHHFGFWDPAQERSVWMPFHFFPSGSAESLRRDGRRSPWKVVPHSPPVKELLVAALRTRDTFRIGIALHTYADSWAHQEFIGQRDDFNALPGIMGIPPLGHAQAERLPDLFQATWHDGRLRDGEINNRRRFLDAARHIYRYLATFQRRTFSDEELVMAELEILLGPEEPPAPLSSMGSTVQASLRRGIQGIRGIAARLGADLSESTDDGAPADPRHPRSAGRSDSELEAVFMAHTGMPLPDRLAWRREALTLDDTDSLSDEEAAGINDKISWLKHELLSRVGYPAQVVNARPGFMESPFYRWCEAARDHAAAASAIIRNIA